MMDECLYHFVKFDGLSCSAWMKVGSKIDEGTRQLESHQDQDPGKVV